MSMKQRAALRMDAIPDASEPLKALVHASSYLAKFPMAKDGACLRIALPMHWERMLA